MSSLANKKEEKLNYDISQYRKQVNELKNELESLNSKITNLTEEKENNTIKLTELIHENENEKKERKMKVIIQLDQLITKKVLQILNIQKNKKLRIKEI